MQPRARSLVTVGLGAALGSVARHLTSVGMLHLLGARLAWGTLTVNVLGSLFIGVYATVTEAEGRWASSPATRLFVLPGVCGGFTTFSIFSLDTLLLVERNAWAHAAIMTLTSVALWLLAVWLGYRLGVRINRGATSP